MKINDISKVAAASLMLYGNYNNASCSQGSEKDSDYAAFRGGGFTNQGFGFYSGGGFSDDLVGIASQPISLEEGGNGLFILNIVEESSSFTQISTTGLGFATLEEVFSDIATSQKRLRSIYVKNFELIPEDFDALCHCIEAQKEALISLSFSGIEMSTEQLELLVEALKDIQHIESFSIEFYNVSFTGESERLNQAIATLIGYGFDSLRINGSGEEHGWSEALRLAFTQSASGKLKIGRNLFMETEFEIRDGEHVRFGGDLGQIDLSWLDIIPVLAGTMPDWKTLELDNCGPDFIEKLAYLAASHPSTTIPLHVIIDEWEQTGEIIEAAFQLPVPHLEVIFRQATYKGITPSWFKCFANEALKSIEICFASDASPVDFWDGLKDCNALKNLEQLKIRTHFNRDNNLGDKTLCAIILNHDNLRRLDIPNLCTEASTNRFRDWWGKYRVDNQDKTWHKNVMLCNTKDAKTMNVSDILSGGLEPEEFSM